MSLDQTLRKMVSTNEASKKEISPAEIRSEMQAISKEEAEISKWSDFDDQFGNDPTVLKTVKGRF